MNSHSPFLSHLSHVLGDKRGKIHALTPYAKAATRIYTFTLLAVSVIHH